MIRRAVVMILLGISVPLMAQAPAWKSRIDGSQASAATANAAVKFAPDEKGFHITGGPGAIFWDPGRTVKGTFVLKATFTLLKPADKATHYGLVFAGTDIEGATPSYIYFTIAQDGTFQIRHRAGDAVHDMDQSPHFTIRKPNANGRATNTLEVQVAPIAVSYLVNGAVVDATPVQTGTGAYTEHTDGIVGIRLDGAVDVQVDGFSVTQ